jgi:hypothetical protein
MIAPGNKFRLLLLYLPAAVASRLSGRLQLLDAPQPGMVAGKRIRAGADETSVNATAKEESSDNAKSVAVDTS